MEGTPTNVDAKKQVDELWEAIAQTANQHFKQSMPERILVRLPFALSIPSLHFYI